MKTWAAMVLILVSAGTADAAKKSLSQEETVTVCMGTPIPGVPAAQSVASGMFAKIGVRIHWVKYGNCVPEAIRITFQTLNDVGPEPEALAYALPYQGRDIVVLYGRIRRFGKDLETNLLAHVLTHEITHILQGVARHSEAGVMKASWTYDDHTLMLHNKPLPFTALDTALIHAGIDSRTARAGINRLAARARVP